jgi:hypothetical protein
MGYNISVGRRRLVVAALLCLGVSALFASDSTRLSRSGSASNRSSLSGSYEVLETSVLGSQSQVRMRLHIVNHGSSPVAIEKITLWTLAHPEPGSAQTVVLTIPAHASIDSVQSFTIRRSDHQAWRKGLRPRLVLQTAGSGNSKNQAMLRLEPTSRLETK